METEAAGERIYATMEARARERRHTAMDVLGYDVVDGRLRVNPEEAERVRYIFEKYIGCGNLGVFANLCNTQGYTGKRGCKQGSSMIRKILTRPVYCGYNVFDGDTYKGSHEPIITVEEFNHVQGILSSRGKGRKLYRKISEK
jgi:site-specific DNA recombinase